jgi:leucyl aminopeptidase (aminopeptidase T)
VEAELVALASAGAAALVQQMVGEAWEQARGRVAEFFARRSGRDVAVIDGELEEARAELVEAERSGDEETRTEALAEWRGRMRRALRNDPAAAAELRALLDELEGPSAEPRQAVRIHNTVSGVTQNGTLIQIGTIGRAGDVNLGGPQAG